MLFGQRVDAVVWGRGDVVRQAGGSALTQTLESMHAKGDAHVWYWGDIDREGLSILSALASAGLVRPLTEAYEAMLETTAARPPRTSPDERDHPIPDIGGLFDQDTAGRMVSIMEQGLLLPQESVSSHAIGEAMR